MQDNCRYKWRYSPIRHKVFMGGPPIRQPISSRLKASFCSLSNIIFFFDEFWNIPGDLLKIPGTYKGSFKGSRPFPAMNVQNYAIYYFSGMFPKERYIKASYFAAITVDQTPARAKNVNKAWWTGDEHWTLHWTREERGFKRLWLFWRYIFSTNLNNEHYWRNEQISWSDAC